MQKILIISASNAVVNSLTELFEHEKYNVVSVRDDDNALCQIKNYSFNLLIVHLPNKENDRSFDWEKIRTSLLDNPIPAIVITKKITDEFRQLLFDEGVKSCITIPINIPEILTLTRETIVKYLDVKPAKKTECAPSESDMNSMLIGSAKKIEKIKNMIKVVAPSQAKVLITGENGTGKEIVAKCLHMFSSRCDRKMIKVNCAAIPGELIESELFGHEKGAFTSAIKQHTGKFEQANDSTLFLDEIGDMSLEAQAKMLRVLQEGKIQRVGGCVEIDVDVRIISATNKNIAEEIKAGRFREDLYHRLSVIEIHMPTLNDRIEDLPQLARSFIAKFCELYKTPLKTIDSGALIMLQTRNWTGNVRELQNVIERLVIFSGDHITENLVDKYIDNI